MHWLDYLVSDFATLQDAFQTFCNNIERIKTEQVEEEYTFNNSFGNPSYNDGGDRRNEGEGRRSRDDGLDGETML